MSFVAIFNMVVYVSVTIGEYRTLPAKPAAEERRHQKLYEEMVTAARRKGETETVHH